MILTVKKIKVIREQKALSVRDLALKAGISPSTIVRIESGLPVRHITKRKIAKALGVEPSYIDFT
jgi:transcriptional regulator with XRE-family HTH domain